MNRSILLPGRRRFLRGMTLGSAAISVDALFHVPGLFADQLLLTPRQEEGPFYPDHLPLDTDNDLLVINDGITPAVGEVTHLTGRILDPKSNPIRNVLVEIWQADSNGVYLHTGSKSAAGRDQNFQGFGRFMTGSSGEYYFRTIKPVLYSGRTRHIHFALKIQGSREVDHRVLRQGGAAERARQHPEKNQRPEGTRSRDGRFCGHQRVADRRTECSIRYRCGADSRSLSCARSSSGCPPLGAIGSGCSTGNPPFG